MKILYNNTECKKPCYNQEWASPSLPRQNEYVQMNNRTYKVNTIVYFYDDDCVLINLHEI